METNRFYREEQQSMYDHYRKIENAPIDAAGNRLFVTDMAAPYWLGRDGEKVNYDPEGLTHAAYLAGLHLAKELLEQQTNLGKAERTRTTAIIAMAQNTHQVEGEVEIDEDARLSEGDDNGAYVAAWVWVDFSNTEFDKEKSDA